MSARWDFVPRSDERSHLARWGFRGSLTVLMLAAGSALAQDTNVMALDTSLPSAGLSLLRVVGALALVLVLFFGAVWLFKNWQRMAVGRGRTPKLHILEARSLGPRQALYVVAYETQRFLVAASPAGVALLTPLPEGRAEPEGAPAALPSFTDALQRVLAQKA